MGRCEVFLRVVQTSFCLGLCRPNLNMVNGFDLHSQDNRVVRKFLLSIFHIIVFAFLINSCKFFITLSPNQKRSFQFSYKMESEPFISFLLRNCRTHILQGISWIAFCSLFLFSAFFSTSHYFSIIFNLPISIPPVKSLCFVFLSVFFSY